MVCPKCGASVNDGDNFCEECGAVLKRDDMGETAKKISFPDSSKYIFDKDLASVTNIGRRHPSNEDAGTAFRLDNGDCVLIVADGVSSSYTAKSASSAVIDVMKQNLYKNTGDYEELLKDAIHQADEYIRQLPYETREDGIYGPEATVAAAVVNKDTVIVEWVGDSRAYIINSGGQELITVDDSWIELVVADGSMTREEAMEDRRAHYVTQVLGMHDQDIEIHVTKHGIRQGDMLLICSDGLWNYFQGEDALFNAILSYGEGSDAVNICERLVNLANSAGGHDNITAALLKV